MSTAKTNAAVSCRDLRHLFDELVRNGIISEGEFWKQRVHLLREAQGPTGSSKQRTGISNALLSRGTDAKGQQNKVRRLEVHVQWCTD